MAVDTTLNQNVAYALRYAAELRAFALEQLAAGNVATHDFNMELATRYEDNVAAGKWDE